MVLTTGAESIQAVQNERQRIAPRSDPRAVGNDQREAPGSLRHAADKLVHKTGRIER